MPPVEIIYIDDDTESVKEIDNSEEQKENMKDSCGKISPQNEQFQDVISKQEENISQISIPQK